MKILVLQLARFGDLYQTWPTLQALRRQFPGAAVHLLVRERFREATLGFSNVAVHSLPTADILAPILANSAAVDEAHARLNSCIESLVALDFDQVLNLSFSPLSSYLTDLFSSLKTDVRGYTRHSDGHFAIPDDSSAYFYAQVGIGRANRYHVTELFASIAGVELLPEDFHLTQTPERRSGVIVHIGASSSSKVYAPELWVKALRELRKGFDGKIGLVGSSMESRLADTVIAQVTDGPPIENHVGQTSLTELVQLIAGAELLLGSDSAPVHIATLTDTPVLNLSSREVCFWETGPLATNSRILYHEDLQKIDPLHIADEVRSILSAQPSLHAYAVRASGLTSYRVRGEIEIPFAWRLIEALYTGAEYPVLENAADGLAFQRLFELAELALQQLVCWQDPKSQGVAATILGQVDILLSEVVKLNPRVEPVVQWFETQRLRIPPGDANAIWQRTQEAFNDLLLVASVYRQYGERRDELKRAIALCRGCAPELRELAFGSVQGDFQNLVSTLQELSRHSTKVGDSLGSWSSVLGGLNAAMEKRDFIELADLLEWQLAPALESELNQTKTLASDVIS